MSDDVWNEKTGPKALTIEQLHKLQATSSAAEMEIELCYSRRKAYIKPLKVLDKKELLKAMENKNETLVNKVFDNILEKYVEIEGYSDSMDKLVMAERVQLLTYIRTANGDRTAKITHVCQNCEKPNSDIDYDLDQLSVKYYTPSEDGDIIKYDLSDGKTVEYHIRPLTRIDEKMCETYINSEKIKTESEKYLVHMSATIHKINVVQNGECTPVELSSISNRVEVFKNLDSTVETKMKKIIRNFDFGIKMPLDFECKHCGYKEKNDEVNVAAFFIS